MVLSSHHEKLNFITSLQKISGGVISPQVIISIIASLGAIVNGTILGWSSPAQAMFKADYEFPFPVTDQHVQTFSSVFGIGALLGALPAGHISSLIGRQNSIILSEGFVFVGWAILVMPTTVWMLSAARVIQGIGVGAMCAIIPPYVGEIAEPQMRGRLGTIFQFFIVSGILYSYTLGSFMTYEPFCMMCGIWVILHVIGILYIPESPYYLMSMNNLEEAAASLKVLRDPYDTTEELAAIKSCIEKQKLQNHSVYQLLSDKVNQKTLIICIGCMFFQQISGINVVIFYMADIFNSTGSHLNPHTCSITVGVIQFVMTFVSFLVVDKHGRKSLLVISGLLMAVCYAGLGIFYMIKVKDQELSVEFNWLPLLCIAVYISVFSIGYGPLPWVIMGEIYSSEVKPIGTSLATCVNWALVFVVTYISNELIFHVGEAGCFLTFCLFCLTGAGFAALVVPETKNQTLAEIQSKLVDKQVVTMATPSTTTIETTVFS